MPREKAESAVKYAVPDGGETGLRGSESDHTAAGDESPDDQHEDFVLSEETLSQLPPKERAIAAAALRAQRENAELRAALARRLDDDDDYEDEPEEPEVPEEDPLKDLPIEGYEKLAPVLKEVLGGLIQENKKLHQRLDDMEEKGSKTARMNDFQTFKRLHPEWTKYDEQMATVARKLGVVPANLDQLEELLDLVKGKVERPSLQAEIERSRKQAPNPKLSTPTSALRGKMATGRNGGRPRNIREAFNESWEKAIRESPV